MKVTYYLTNSASLNSIKVATGNLIFCQDEKKIYVDGTTGRRAYEDITTFATDAQRKTAINVVNGFYFVEETDKIWRYSGTWKCLNPTVEQAKQILFMPYDDFPAFGDPEKLYIDGTNIYVWNEEIEDYELANASEGDDWIDI